MAATAPATNPATNNRPPAALSKLYYPSRGPLPLGLDNRRNNDAPAYPRRRGIHSGNILQYYYNNINNNEITAANVNGDYLAKQSNININNIYAISADNRLKVAANKGPFSSTVRPLAVKLVTPKHKSNFFLKTFRSDSQKRPLLLNYTTSNNEFRDANGCAPNFKIIPDKTGLKISPIYSISQNVDRFTPRKLRHQSAYFRNASSVAPSSSSRPLFVKK